jgi:hypothetical protein
LFSVEIEREREKREIQHICLFSYLLHTRRGFVREREVDRRAEERGE